MHKYKLQNESLYRKFNSQCLIKQINSTLETWKFTKNCQTKKKISKANATKINFVSNKNDRYSWHNGVSFPPSPLFPIVIIRKRIECRFCIKQRIYPEKYGNRAERAFNWKLQWKNPIRISKSNSYNCTGQLASSKSWGSAR